MPVQTDGTQEGQTGQTGWVQTEYVARKMKILAVLESEVSALTSFNAQATVFVAVGSALLSFAAGILINRVFYTDIPPEARVATYVAAPVLALLSIVFFVLAAFAWFGRHVTLNKIRKESKQDASAVG